MMKLNQIFIITTILVATLLINCNSPTASTNDKNLIGSWQQQGGGYAFTFNADKSYYSTLNGGQEVSGQWTTSSEGLVLGEGTPIRYSIFGNIMILDFPTANSTYQKLKIYR